MVHLDHRLLPRHLNSNSFPDNGFEALGPILKICRLHFVDCDAMVFQYVLPRERKLAEETGEGPLPGVGPGVARDVAQLPEGPGTVGALVTPRLVLREVAGAAAASAAARTSFRLLLLLLLLLLLEFWDEATTKYLK